MGVDTSQFKLTGNPEADVKTALAYSGQLDNWEKSQQPQYMSPQPGSPMVNVRDPNAINSYNQWVSGGAQGQPQAQTPQAPQQQPHPNFTQVLSPQQFAQAFQGIPPQAAAETAAKAGTVVKVSSPQEALQLPSGTWILLPDNTYGRVP